VEVLPPAPRRAALIAPARQVVRSGGWFEAAVVMMALPVIITAGMMLAPLGWLWTARKSSHG
jgi:hypothetical protein